jgi:Family of unknown function (DUF6062)
MEFAGKFAHWGLMTPTDEMSVGVFLLDVTMRAHQERSSSKWLEFIHLCDAVQADGCAICTLIEKACHRHLDNLFYESVNDVGVRQRLFASKGFCNRHAHLATRVPNADSGIAIIYSDLLRGIIERTTVQPTRRSPAKLLVATAGCPICETARFNERVFLGELLRWFDDAELQSKYRPSFGLCLPHLQLAHDQFPEHPQLPALLAAEREKLVALRSELQEFTRKRDYRYADEPKGHEQTSWRRVVEKFVGKREMLLP